MLETVIKRDRDLGTPARAPRKTAAARKTARR